jgi:hypothetical protein
VFYKISRETIKGTTGFDDERPYVEFLSIKENLQAIRDGLYNGGKEGSEEWESDMIDLRGELWWAFNDDLRRDRPDTDFSAYADNCRELLHLLTDFCDDEDYLRRAELHRNIGEFDQCKQMLQQIKEPAEFEAYITAISKAANEENTLSLYME